jgi:hypothetical protein
MAKPIVRKGTKAMPSSGNSEFLGIKPDESVTIAPLAGIEDMISIDQHVFWVDGGSSPMFPCIGEGCPGCAMGDSPRYRASLPVLTKEDGPKIFSFGTQVARQLSEIASELGNLKGAMLKVKRTGSGLKTSYTVVAVGKSVKTEGVKVPDVEKAIGPTTREEIVKLLEEAGMDVPTLDGTTVAEKEETAFETEGDGTKKADDDWGAIA